MTDLELALYYFPHSMTHWPDKVNEIAREARGLISSAKGREVLNNLRKDFEQQWLDGGRYA